MVFSDTVSKNGPFGHLVKALAELGQSMNRVEGLDMTLREALHAVGLFFALGIPAAESAGKCTDSAYCQQHLNECCQFVGVVPVDCAVLCPSADYSSSSGVERVGYGLGADLLSTPDDVTLTMDADR